MYENSPILEFETRNYVFQICHNFVTKRIMTQRIYERKNEWGPSLQASGFQVSRNIIQDMQSRVEVKQLKLLWYFSIKKLSIIFEEMVILIHYWLLSNGNLESK